MNPLQIHGGYAAVVVTPVKPTADAASLVLRKRKTGWAVISGPGTSFDRSEFRKLGVPRALWRHFILSDC